MTDNKLPLELAEQEFERLCDKYSVDTDMTGESQDTVDGFNDIKRKIVKAFMKGSLVIADSGFPAYTTTAGKRLEFKEVTGATLMSMDRIKDGENTKKMFTVISELTGGGVAPASLSMPDVKVLIALVSLFLSM